MITRLQSATPLPRQPKKRRKTICIICAICLFILYIAGIMAADAASATDLNQRYMPPCLQHLFGTDQLGRDMLARTLQGLKTGILLGILSTLSAGILGLFTGILSIAGGNKVEKAIGWIMDLLTGIPQIVLMILISYATGKGFAGIYFGITLTFWIDPARVIQTELKNIQSAPYITIAKKSGVSTSDIIKNHYLPHLLPQLITGLLLLFPKAILAEASLSFLGFGLSSEIPSIGRILADSVQYITLGMWWLALFPGTLLFITILLLRKIGNSL